MDKPFAVNPNSNAGGPNQSQITRGTPQGREAIRLPGNSKARVGGPGERAIKTVRLRTKYSVVGKVMSTWSWRSCFVI
jgi:hypothetical protein